jgi:hypothetical protein
MPRFKRGIQYAAGLSLQALLLLEYWISAFAGMTIVFVYRSSQATDRP